MTPGKGTTCPDCGDLRNQAYRKGMTLEWGCEVPDHTKAGETRAVPAPPVKPPRPRGR